MAKGFKQIHGVDYDETFSTMERLDIVRTILEIVAQNHWQVYQLEVKSTFLNGILKEEVYLDQPPRYEIK